MNTFKQGPEDLQEKKCVCKTNMGLFIPNKQLSLVTAGGILIAFSTFIIGYFVGQHTAVESFTSKVEQESFADQIYASLFTPGEYQAAKEVDEPEIEQTQLAQDNEQKETNNPEEVVSESVAQLSDEIQEEQSEENIELNPQEKYFAQLIGFGTDRAAQKFAHRLEAKNIPVAVKKRRSKTAKGKMVNWYQVITKEFENKEKLRELVDRIEKTEKIKGAQIVSC